MIVYGLLVKAINAAVRLFTCLKTKKEDKMAVDAYKKILGDLEKASGIALDSFRKNEDYLASNTKRLRENGTDMQENPNKLLKREHLANQEYEENLRIEQQHHEELHKLKRKIEELEDALQASKLEIMEMDPDRKKVRHETEQVKKRNN
ncbi:hypothetical protein MOSE0_B00672 [Monosporozyma servazzii]